MKKKYGFSNEFYTKIIVLFVIGITFISIIGSMQIFIINKDISKSIETEKEENRPANLNVTIITADCQECISLTPFVNKIEKLNVKMEKSEINYKSEMAKKIIKKYNIKKVPVIIFEGEIEKTTNLNRRINEISDKKGDAYISNIVQAPFVDPDKEIKRGLVSVTTIIDSNCKDCFDINLAKNQILQNIKIKQEKTVERNSKEGKELIKKYKIEKIPSLILDSEANYYDSINKIWIQIGTTENDSSKILRLIPAPYFDVKKNKAVGMVEMTVITDNSCKDCYDAETVFNQIMKKMGIKVTKTTIVDISNTELIKKYALTKVPTVIFKGDLKMYPNFIKAWNQAGYEVNGSYIFRNVEILKLPYKDLTTGEVI